MIDNPWSLPTKKPGTNLPNITFRMDGLFTAAVQTLADRETKRLGRKISQPTILTNLTTNDANFFRTKRTELRSIYQQLKKEQLHENKQHTATQEAISADLR